MQEVLQQRGASEWVMPCPSPLHGRPAAVVMGRHQPNNNLLLCSSQRNAAIHADQPPSSQFLYFKSQAEGGGITLQYT